MPESDYLRVRCGTCSTPATPTCTLRPPGRDPHGTAGAYRRSHHVGIHTCSRLLICTHACQIELLQVGPRGDLVVGSDELRILTITSKGTIVHWFALKTASRNVSAELCLVLRYLSGARGGGLGWAEVHGGEAGVGPSRGAGPKTKILGPECLSTKMFFVCRHWGRCDAAWLGQVLYLVWMPCCRTASVCKLFHTGPLSAPWRALLCSTRARSRGQPPHVAIIRYRGPRGTRAGAGGPAHTHGACLVHRMEGGRVS